MGNVLGAGLGIIGQVADYNDKMDAANAQRKQAVNQMNFNFQSYELERQDAFDAAVDEIAKTRMRASASQATVTTAIGEQMGQGRTSKLLTRSSEANEARAVADIQENFKQKSNEIDLNKEAVLKSAQSYTARIKNPSLTGLGIGIASSVMGAQNQAKTAQADAQLKNVPFDWDNYWWTGSGVTPRKSSKAVTVKGRYNDNG